MSAVPSAVTASEGWESKPTKEKGTWRKSGGNHAQASESPLPVKSHRMHSTPPPTNREDIWECCIPGNWRLSAQGFLLGASHQTTFCLAHNKTSESQKENRSYINPIVCTNRLGTWRDFHHLRNEGIPSKVQVPLESTEGQPCKQTFLCLTLSYTTFQEDMVAFRDLRPPV